MSADRNAMHGSPDAPDGRQETVTADAFQPGMADDVSTLVEAHRRTAARLLQSGRATHAFGELVRASRAVPMTGRLAALLVTFSLRASAEPAAITLLQSALDEGDEETKLAVRRQLIRLFRRLKAPERAREHLVLVLADHPHDRRARAVLNALLEAEGRWDELDASLEKEAREALKQSAYLRAARATLLRARVYERLGNHGRAALRYGQAAQLLQDCGNAEGAFDVRLLWVRSLREAQAPKRALDEAVQAFLSSGAACGQIERARKVAETLGVLPGAPAPRAGRRETQRELLVAAEAADAGGRTSEATALFHAAANEGPDPDAVRKFEAHLVARRAWRELAQFYGDRARDAQSDAERVELLTRLAELLEDELQDGEGAAAAYAEIVRLTGDDAALREQVRLLSSKQDQSGVRRAFDSAVDSAHSGKSRAKALTARAEAALRSNDVQKAQKDFDAALADDHDNLTAHAGRAEAAARKNDLEPARAFALALKAAPRRFPGRADLCRRLATLAGGALNDAELAKWAWTEVLSEVPEDSDAADRVADLARATADDFTLEDALGRMLKHEARGPRARQARLELVALLERNGRRDDAMIALREATKFEPGHKEAWLLLAERYAERGQNAEAAWALEQAATSTEDDLERAGTWMRLAHFTKEVLKDPARASVFERRAKKLHEEHPPRVGAQVLSPAPSPDVTPPEGETTARITTDPEGPATFGPADRTDTDQIPLPDIAATARTEFELPVVTPEELIDALSGKETDDTSGSALRPLEVPWDEAHNAPDDFLEITTGDLLINDAEVERDDSPPPVADWDAPPGRMDMGPGTVELPVPLGDSGVSATPSLPTPAVSRLREQRTKLLERVRKDPLNAEGYQALAQYFDDVGDPERSGLMAEIAAALEGDPHAAPRTPKLILSATDRAGLRHPTLRGEQGELLALAGVALSRVFPARGRDAGSREEFRLDAGRGANAAADALLAAVRILGVRAPDVYLSEDNGPPFALAFTSQGPRVLVGRLAIKRVLPDGELRFFAGRALFTQNPDLLALRNLKKDQLARGLSVLASIVRGGRQLSAEARAMRDGIAPKAVARIQELLQSVPRELPVQALIEAARHSANRAGLVVAGGVAPALAALRAKKALKSEIAELVRFAASERYLQLRTRRLG